MTSICSRVVRSLSLAAALAPLVAAQSTWYVDVNGVPPGSGTSADPYTSIQYAIDRPTTVSGDTVLVRPGRYVENVIYGGKSIVLASTAGADSTVIDGNDAGSCVQIVNGETSAAVLAGFTLENGYNPVGAGLRTYTASPEIRDCVIRDNISTQRGGGIWTGFGSATIHHCVVTENLVAASLGEGGGLYAMYGFALTIESCTFHENNATLGAHMKIDYGGNVNVRNVIMWGAPSNAVHTYASSPSFSYCDVQGGLAGTGNFDADPLFWNLLGADFHLKPGSPCIDTGDPLSPLDPDGSRADVGAHPFDPSYCGAPVIYCTAKVNSEGCLPAISFSGLPSASNPSQFVIGATRAINNKAGIVFYGFGQDATPFQGGTRCVDPPLRRTPTQNSGGNPPPNDCSGSFAYDFNARIQSGVDPLLVPGATVYAQYYHRDPPASFGVGLSDALAFTICP